MNVCYCFSTACDCNEVDDWHLACTVSHDCFSLMFESSGAIRGCSVGTASSPSVGLLSNHGCGSDSLHLMALFQGRFSFDGNYWLSRGITLLLVHIVLVFQRM